MKAPFAYYGGKMGMARLIVSLMPQHRVYLEPFLGSGSVLFVKAPATHEIVNDVDNSIVSFFRVLRERPEDLARVCRLTPHARTEYLSADLEVEVDDLERARRFWIRVNQSFAKTAGKRTGWSVTTARSQSVPASIVNQVSRFDTCAERLRRVTIECCDGVALIERLATSDAVIYADPPYLDTSRSPGRGSLGDYRHEMATEADHRRLADVLRTTPATVLLSSYPNPLYEELYRDWCVLDVPVTAFSSNAQRKTGRTSRVERIWSNRAINKASQSALTFEAAP